MTVEEKACCLRIMDHYGAENQEAMTIGECADLIVALRHKARGRATADDVIDEIADVIIMTQQLSFIYGQSKVDNKIKEKLDRQLERIRNEKPQPKADVVSVVRCRDCKHFYKPPLIETCDYVSYCEYCDNWTGTNDYCSKGERREASKVKPQHVSLEAD
jgi:NTP pyrophosphatase (non-canonical NTP hydrolase)